MPMTTGRLLLEKPGGGQRHAASQAAISHTRAAGVEQDVINDNNGEFVFIEIKAK